MGYLLVLLSGCSSRLGNLHNLSHGANYVKFGCARYSHSLHRIRGTNFCVDRHSLSAASLIGARDQRLSEYLRTSTQQQRLQSSYSSYSLGNYQFERHALLSRDFVGLQWQRPQYFHSSCAMLREESKVEETLEALKDTIKESAAGTTAKGALENTAQAVVETPKAQVTVVAPAKKPLRERIVAELKHYYHGFKLLFIDVKVCARLLWQVLHGRPLMRREQKQLVRTTADLFRLVPFLVIIIIPFAEFALPVLLKFFPEMLPSTFKEENKELEKRKKRLKMKLEMAKFLQDTIEETSLQRQGATGESVHDFVKFIEKIRTSGVQTTNEEILKYSKLFEDEITLDNLNYDQLRALCRLLEVPAVGTSYFLRFQIDMKLRQLEADDKLIQKEGVESMAVWELQEACRMRGMRSFGVSEQRLKSQLNQWLDLHLKQKVPTSLLLLSRTLYLPEHLSTEDQLRAALSALPAETMAEEAKVKILEVTGDRVDNKSKLEVIIQEEEIIQREKEELEKQEQAEKLKAQAAAAKSAAVAGATEQELLDTATVLDQKESEKLAEIDTEDLGKIEDILDHVIASKNELKKEVEELEALKEDLTEYQENLEDVKEVVQLSAGALPGLKESKAAQLLSRKVSKMIEQMDEVVKELTTQKRSLIDDIKAKEGNVEARTSDGKQVDDSSKRILDQISQERNSLITINELLEAINKLQHVSDSTKFEAIARVLDEDKDGVIDYNEAMKVIELLGKENVKLNARQMSEIMSVLRKEKALLEEEKQQKLEERKQQQQQQQSTASSSNKV